MKNTHNRDPGKMGGRYSLPNTSPPRDMRSWHSNARTASGEIDLIARKGGLLVFVEVKTRRGDDYGNPEESITPIKQQHMEDSAHAWLAEHPEEGGDWQFDVIAIVQTPGGNQPEITHLEGTLD